MVRLIKGADLADFKCRRCGELMHLGRCGVGVKLDQVPGLRSVEHSNCRSVLVRIDSISPTIDRLPTGEIVVKRNGVTVAHGFDTYAEAQAWIDEQ